MLGQREMNEATKVTAREKLVVIGLGTAAKCGHLSLPVPELVYVPL